MPSLQILVTRPESQGALAAAAGAAVHDGPIDALAPDAVTIVFADDLARYAEALPADQRRRRLERTLVLNADRVAVVELLEHHGLGGAIECGEPAAWRERAQLFVRKDAVALRDGELIDASLCQSARYALWVAPRVDPVTAGVVPLCDVVRRYAADCVRFARRDDQLQLTAADARDHGLPPIGLRLGIGRVPMVPQPFPRPGCYVAFDGPPGGILRFRIDDDRSGGSITDAARQALIDERVPPIIGAPEQLRIAGEWRSAIACILGQAGTMSHAAECWIRIPHRTGALVVRAATSSAALEPACAAVLHHPALAALADTLRLVDD